MPKDYIYKRIVERVVDALRMERERLGISMSTVAKKAGMSQSMMSLVERNLRSPTLDTLLRIAITLEFDLGKAISKAMLDKK